jgi:hypothetical protein
VIGTFQFSESLVLHFETFLIVALLIFLQRFILDYDVPVLLRRHKLPVESGVRSRMGIRLIVLKLGSCHKLMISYTVYHSVRRIALVLRESDVEM